VGTKGMCPAGRKKARMKPICVRHNMSSYLRNHHIGCASGLGKKKEKKEKKYMIVC